MPLQQKRITMLSTTTSSSTPIFLSPGLQGLGGIVWATPSALPQFRGGVLRLEPIRGRRLRLFYPETIPREMVVFMRFQGECDDAASVNGLSCSVFRACSRFVAFLP